MNKKMHIISIAKVIEENENTEIIYNKVEELVGQFLADNNYLLCSQVEDVPESDL